MEPAETCAEVNHASIALECSDYQCKLHFIARKVFLIISTQISLTPALIYLSG